MKRIYFDNAATTPLNPQVLEAMLPYFSQEFENPSSIYSAGSKTRVALEKARETIALAIGAKKEEIFFTSGGTEADNWALKGIAYNMENKGKHIISSQIEHPAILNTCKELERQGFDITYIAVDKDGIIDLEELESSVRPDTILISIMYANNEVGSLQAIKEIGQIAKDRGILFHSDAVQAIGSIKIDVREENIDLLSLSAHKFNGPKGIGCLYVRQGIDIDPLISGGLQESSRRGGTENVPAIIGMAKAIELAYEELDEKNAYILKLRNYLIDEAEKRLSKFKLNGHPDRRLVNNINFSPAEVKAESLLLNLDMAGISISSGSACYSGSLEPSHVLQAMGLDQTIVDSSIRVSLSASNTKEEVDYFLDKLVAIVNRLTK